MGIVNGISIVNNLIAGSMSGAQLQTYLATGANLASFVQVVNVRRQLQVLRNTPAAVTAVTASATASATVAANDTALRQWLLYGTSYNWRSFANLAELLASAPAMAEVAASQPAMALLVTSASAMAAVADSSTAMTAIAASAAGMTAVIASSTAMTAVAASSTAMTAVAASATAMGLVAASATAMAIVSVSAVAMAAVAASSTAMTAVIASSTAMAAMFASTTAKTALYDSTTASTAIFASTSAKAYLVTIAQTSNAPSSTAVAANAGRTYFLQQKVTSGGSSVAGATPGSSTYTTTSTAFVDRFVKLAGLYHRIGGGSYVGTVTFVDMD